jgi:hypothetical protein
VSPSASELCSTSSIVWEFVVDKADDKVDDGVKSFYFFYFLDFLAALDAMVADEGGVRKSICAICVI